MKTIKINGSYEMNFVADYLNIYFNLNNKFDTYEECLNDSNLAKDYLYDLIETNGFNKDELKLTNFEIYPVNETYVENEVYKTRKNGYAYHHSYELGMDLDFIRLAKLLESLEDNDKNISFNLSFTLKNDKSAKDLVLKHALKECLKKAKTIAKISDLELVGISSIEYDSYNNRLERPMNMALKANANNFKPNDISVRENIVVTYEVK